MKGLTDIPGVLVGHASDYDSLTGCTAILCEGGAVAGVDVRGSATGTEELEVLKPQHVTDRIHAISLAGGSAFGLEAASGVRRYLGRKGLGYATRYGKVPLVAGAILYDLGVGQDAVRPTREMGEAAAAAASSKAVIEGAVGAGTGATVGKAYGYGQAMKGGIGSWTVSLTGRYKGLMVSALVAVNAFGDVLDPRTGQIIAGVRTAKDSKEFADCGKLLQDGLLGRPMIGENTTLAVIATNARLNKVEATKLAQLAQIGMARSIRPVHTMFDGDIVFALSVGEMQADVNALGVAAGDALQEAIVRAVRLAPTMGGIPGLASV